MRTIIGLSAALVLAIAGCSGSTAEREASPTDPKTTASPSSTGLPETGTPVPTNVTSTTPTRPRGSLVISCENDPRGFASLREVWESDADRNYCNVDLERYVPTAPETELAKAFIKSSDWPDEVTNALEDMYGACANSDRDAETIFDEELTAKFTSDFAARLCPEAPHVTLLRAVGAGRYFADGDYAIPRDLKPGKYRTGRITVTACNWQRMGDGGRTLVNALVTNEPKGVTVHIRSTDRGFSSHGCGVWKRVD